MLSYKSLMGYATCTKRKVLCIGTLANFSSVASCLIYVISNSQ